MTAPSPRIPGRKPTREEVQAAVEADEREPVFDRAEEDDREYESCICGLCNGNGCFFCANRGEIAREIERERT